MYMSCLCTIHVFQVLISRNYKGDIETNVIDKFNTLLLEKEEDNNTTPVIQTDGVTFAYIKHNNVYRILSRSGKLYNIACGVNHTSLSSYL